MQSRSMPVEGSSSSRLRIIVTGLIAQHPHIGGMAWHYAQYAAGLSLMGHDVYYFEDSGEWPYTEDGGPTGDEWIARDCSSNIDHLTRVLSKWGLQEKWAYRFPLTGDWFGLSQSSRREVEKSADLLINVSGTLEFPEHYRDVKCMVYIDSDPVFTQSKILNDSHGIAARVNVHDVHFSFGERIAELPLDTGHRWTATRQPIVLSEWEPSKPHRETFTTVMNWTSYDPAVVDGRAYGQKDREFARFIGVAKRAAPIEIEIAMGRTQHQEWENAALAPTADTPGRGAGTPHELLAGLGWGVVETNVCCSDPESYRDYIVSSKGEWSIAKEAYVAHRPGWFSERSACYLAAGRPVIVQDTGFDVSLPVGEGLIPFTTVDEAVAGIRSVTENYASHADAARAVAEDFFDSSKVLELLIENALSVHA